MGGQCVDPRCTPESPEFCGEGVLCDASKNDEVAGNPDCPVTAECAIGECLEGTCWARAREEGEANACDSGVAWCHPDFSCVALGDDPEDPETCFDGVQNGEELAIDCGGPLCVPCPLPTLSDDECLDGEQNGEETGIDCGGFCTPCPEDDFCFTQSDVPVHECLALLALYESTGGEGWNNNSGWLSESSVCTWQGITCDGDHVEQLNYSNNNLTGSLPREIGNLRLLERLSMGEPSLGGSIPSEIGNLTRLQLFAIEGTLLSGSIPSEIGNLAQLIHLGLGSNQLSGSLPASIGNLANLSAIFLAHNSISGPLPASIGNLAKLSTLTINDNNIEGPLPDTWDGLIDLDSLELGGNLIDGSIPESMGSLPRLQNLVLAFNQLSGDVPASLVDLPVLSSLNISSNACLYTTACAELKPWLDGIDSDWQSSNRGSDCSPPPAACE